MEHHHTRAAAAEAAVVAIGCFEARRKTVSGARVGGACARVKALGIKGGADPEFGSGDDLCQSSTGA